MKKFLSFILALAFVLTMLPATFAADGATAPSEEAISFDFTFNSRNQAGKEYLERNLGATPAKFTTYPKDQATPDTDAKDQWIYLGMNANYSGSKSSSPWIRIDGTGAILTHQGLNMWPVSTVGETTVGEGYIALQIYIPTTGIYDLSMSLELQALATQNAEIYIGKTTDTLNQEYFKSTAVVGTKKALTAGTDTNPYTNTTCTESNDRIREGAKKFSELGIPESYLMASGVSLRYDVPKTIKLKNQLIVEETGDYLFIIRNKDTDGSRIGVAGLTLTPAKLDKTHKYVFGRPVLKGAILENTAFTQSYDLFYIPEGESVYSGNYLDSYDHVDKNLTDEWCVSILGGKVSSGSSYRKGLSSLANSGIDMATRKDMAHSTNATARFVIQLKVKHNGIYDIMAKVSEFDHGTDADVFMIKTSDVTEINPSVLKNYKSIGRVGNVKGRADTYVGAASLTEGDWYIVFDFNTTNTIQSSSSPRQIFRLSELTFTEIDALPESGATPDAAGNVAPLSFSATTNIPDKAKVTINGVEGNLSIINPSRGAGISVSAPEVDGYKFIGWMAGSTNDAGDGELANTAKFVNGLAQEDIFTIYTSTFLTAVYEEIAPSENTDSVVEFWNLDGSYLGQKSVTELEALADEGKALETSLIGHTFAGWFTKEDVALDISSIIEKITHAVADYTADKITGNGIRVNGVELEDANAYGKEVVCTDNAGTVTHWIRDGKIVSYDPTYKYYVWGATNISSSYAPIERKPLVVLDDETISDAYMIEYDGAGKTIVEVGILFGNGNVTVASKSEIFKSQRGSNHGQFAARPTNSNHTARGYMIYEENGEYKVIYSE